MGRLVFLLANDLTNNHLRGGHAAQHPRRPGASSWRSSASRVIKGLMIADVERLSARSWRSFASPRSTTSSRQSAASAINLRRAAALPSVRHHRQDERQPEPGPGGTTRSRPHGSPPSRHASSTTSSAAPRCTCLSEFDGEGAAAVDQELERQSDERRLYTEYRPVVADSKHRPDPRSCVAATWRRRGRGRPAPARRKGQQHPGHGAARSEGAARLRPRAIPLFAASAARTGDSGASSCRAGERAPRASSRTAKRARVSAIPRIP
ncbi:MAG: hypothetical protein MZV49_24025 [Rhodopseudomonas palustris]|nr:hypothetical protein [Rhodopseudomonas palustris]